MKLKKYTFLTLLLFPFLILAQSNWTLIYENDSEGKAIRGELNELIAAIQDGEEIRIYFRMGRPNEPEIFVEHTALAKYITIMNSPEGRFVTAQIDPIVGQTPNFKEQHILLKENLEWSLIASTNGKNDTMTRNTITGEIISHVIHKWGTKWYVQKTSAQ
ncbi:MAG: hypothetical protein WBG90_05190 [Saonia sp.]